MNSVERVRAICAERKIAISRLERDLGFSNGYIGQLRKGVFPADRLVKIAEYLDVSPDYLINGETKKAHSGLGEGVNRVPDDMETRRLLKVLESREDLRYLAAAAARATPEHVMATAEMFDKLYGKEE